MSKIGQLVKLNDDGKKEINIYIHGYGISGDVDISSYIADIGDLELRGSTYFLKWDSGSVMSNLPIPLRHILKPFKTGLFALFTKNFKVAIVKAVADIAISKVIIEPIRFSQYSFKAEKLGLSLKTHISKLPNAKKYPINIYAFSLGARVVHWALDQDTDYWKDYNINNIVLLGGAASNNSDEWKNCVANVKGTIYNVYSKEDRILNLLKKAADKISIVNFFEDSIGQFPIRVRGIVNVRQDIGHLEYREKFDHIVSKILPNRVRTRRYTGIVNITCPWKECGAELIGAPYELIECPDCGTTFKYNQYEDNCEYSDKYPEPISMECPLCEELLSIQESAEYECPYCGTWTKCERKGKKVEYYAECNVCEGEGQVECLICDGWGILDCGKCEGVGYIACGFCKGEGCGHCNDEGYMPCRKCDDGSVSCPECDGIGELICEECNGEGMVWYDP